MLIAIKKSVYSEVWWDNVITPDKEKVLIKSTQKHICKEDSLCIYKTICGFR